jgi:hypothetical protein
MDFNNFTLRHSHRQILGQSPEGGVEGSTRGEKRGSLSSNSLKIDPIRKRRQIINSFDDLSQIAATPASASSLRKLKQFTSAKGAKIECPVKGCPKRFISTKDADFRQHKRSHLKVDQKLFVYFTIIFKLLYLRL